MSRDRETSRPPPTPFDSAAVASTYEDTLPTPAVQLALRLKTELLLELLGEAADPAEPVLEIGCGTGLYGAELAVRGVPVIGVDLSREMLRLATGRTRRVQADAARLPFRDGTFERVFLVALLDFVADPVAALREARRVARRRVVVLALAKGSWIGWRRRMQGRSGHPIFSAARFYSRAQLLRFAREAGAEAEAVRGIQVLPAGMAGRWPSLEGWLSRRSLPLASIVGFRLAGGAP